MCRPPKHGKLHAPVETPDSAQVGSVSAERVVGAASASELTQEPSSGSDASLDPGPSTSYANATELRRARRERRAACSPDRDSRVRISKRLRRISPSPGRRHTRLQDAPCGAELCSPWTSDSGSEFLESVGDQQSQAIDRQRGAKLPSVPRRTIQAHIEPSFVSVETAQVHASGVRESLGAKSATERKLEMMRPQVPETPAASEDEFIIVQKQK